MDEKQFQTEVATKSRQFSYNVEGLGRCHIRQTGQYITGLKIADDIEFAFGAPAEETDYIIKTGIFIMQYVKGEQFSIPVPNVMSAEDGEEELLLSAIMSVGYGSVVYCEEIGATLETYKKLRDKMCMELVVPFHRVVYKDEPEYSQKLRTIEIKNYPKYQEALATYLAKQSPMGILGNI